VRIRTAFLFALRLSEKNMKAEGNDYRSPDLAAQGGSGDLIYNLMRSSSFQFCKNLTRC
jgi:hypothetical protein